MEIRDALHGLMPIGKSEAPIIHSKYLQRLRQVRQLGFGDIAFPSANHSRFAHSLGAMHVATQAFESIFPKDSPAFTRFRSIVRLAALLHDIGHGPLSHATEFAMPNIRKLKLNLGLPESQAASHEHYALKMILDSDLSALIETAGQSEGFKPLHIAALLDRSIVLKEKDEDFFFHQGSNFRPLLTQIISSEIDADRMDYLRRDSLHTGVNYGTFDYTWILSHLTFHEVDKKCYLALKYKAIYAFEDFLISRFHMFLMIYFHHKSVIYDEMLKQYFKSPDCSYSLPSDVEEYSKCNDNHLSEHLAQSSNPWAKRIHEKNPFQVLIEQRSGFPIHSKHKLKQKNLESMQKILQENKIESILSTSSSEISKYFLNNSSPNSISERYPIYVRYEDHFHSPEFFLLEQCTDLFEKYKEKQWVTRLYVAAETDLNRVISLLKP